MQNIETKNQLAVNDCCRQYNSGFNKFRFFFRTCKRSTLKTTRKKTDAGVNEVRKSALKLVPAVETDIVLYNLHSYSSLTTHSLLRN